MSDVFISYSRLDREFVGRLREALIAKEQDVWIDWEDIPPSQSWWDEIQKGIAKANNIVLVLSPNSMGSVVCNMEIEYARQLKKRIIPVLYAAYERDACVGEMNKRLAKPEEFTTRELWGSRQPQSMYDANDGDLKHINFFFFSAEDDFQAKFEALFEIIHTDYAYKEQHTTYLLRANEWNKRGRDVSFLLLDTELDQAENWFKSSPGKQPIPTELQLAYIQASEKRTRQLHNIRRASIIGSALAVIALIFAVGASLVGVQATNNANLASTREGAANTQVANANGALTAVPPTLTLVYQQVVTAQGQANAAGTQVANAQATATQIPPTLTQAAIVEGIMSDFSNAMYQADNPDTQLAQMNQIVAQHPDQAAAYEARGGYYDKNGETDLAIADYTQAIRLDPQDSDVYVLRGILLGDKGEEDAELADFNQAILINPKNGNAYGNRGAVFLSQGDVDKALADLNQAILFDPQTAIYYIVRGDIHNSQNDPEGAIADYSQAIQLDPQNADAYIYRGTVRYNQGDFSGAIADCTQALQINPQSPDAFSLRGQAYFALFQAETDEKLKLSDLQRAVSDYQSAESFGYTIPSDVAEALQQAEAGLGSPTAAP